MNSNFSSVTNFIWDVADLLRDVYKRKDYPDVILPFTVLRRLDCVLIETKDNVLETYNEYYSKLEDPSDVLMKASFSMASLWLFSCNQNLHCQIF